MIETGVRQTLLPELKALCEAHYNQLVVACSAGEFPEAISQLLHMVVVDRKRTLFFVN